MTALASPTASSMGSGSGMAVLVVGSLSVGDSVFIAYSPGAMARRPARHWSTAPLAEGFVERIQTAYDDAQAVPRQSQATIPDRARVCEGRRALPVTRGFETVRTVGMLSLCRMGRVCGPDGTRASRSMS